MDSAEPCNAIRLQQSEPCNAKHNKTTYVDLAKPSNAKRNNYLPTCRPENAQLQTRRARSRNRIVRKGSSISDPRIRRWGNTLRTWSQHAKICLSCFYRLCNRRADFCEPVVPRPAHPAHVKRYVLNCVGISLAYCSNNTYETSYFPKNPATKRLSGMILPRKNGPAPIT